jgi:hypothetical protein
MFEENKKSGDNRTSGEQTDLTGQLFFGQDRAHRSFVLDKITVAFIHTTPNKSIPGIHILVALCVHTAKAYYQAFFRVLIDLIVELFGLIIKPFDNQTES